jgi:hypothetical protein
MEPLASGNRLPSGRSTNLEAAVVAFADGAASSFLGAYAGLRTTKSCAVFAGSCATFWLSASTGAGVLAFSIGAAAATTGVASPIFRVSFWPGPGTSSYFAGRSRSTTTRVMAPASVPMRTLLTPSLPTVMRPPAVASTVFGRSITKRSGEDSVSTFGVTAPLVVISTVTTPWPRLTVTF